MQVHLLQSEIARGKKLIRTSKYTMTALSISFVLSRLPDGISRRLSGTGGVVVFSAAVRAFTLISQFIVILVMSWLLPKSSFGDAMIAFTIYRLLSLAVGTAAGSLLLYHVSREGGSPTIDIRLKRTLTVTTICVSGLLSVCFALMADPIALLFSKPGLSSWLVSLCPIIIFGSLNAVTAGSFDGRSKVTLSIVLTEGFPNALRLVGFPLLVLFAAPDVWVAHVLWISLALPWLLDATGLFDARVKGFAPLSLWDIKYGVWSGLNPLFGQQLQGLDMIIVGALFSSGTAAEYSIASRLATLFPFLQQIAVRGFIPRAGNIIAAGKFDLLNAEFKMLRAWSLVLVALMSATIIAPSVLYLPAFGDYLHSYALIIGLAAAPLVRCMFVGIDVALRMTGKAGYSALISACSAGVIVIFSLLLYRSIGIQAIAFSMFISAVSINLVSAYLINRSGIVVADKNALLGVVIGLAGIVASLWIDNPLISPLCCCLFLIVAAGSTLIKSR